MPSTEFAHGYVGLRVTFVCMSCGEVYSDVVSVSETLSLEDIRDFVTSPFTWRCAEYPIRCCPGCQELGRAKAISMQRIARH